MMSVWKFLIFALIIMIGACGCMSDYEKGEVNSNISEESAVPANNPEGQSSSEAQVNSGGSTRERIIEHLESKYPDDSFYYVTADPGGTGRSSGSVTVRSGKYPDARIVVLYSRENGVYSFSDNYIYFRYEEEVSRLIEQVLTEIFHHEFMYYFVGSPVISAFNTGYVTSLDEFVSNPLSSLSFSVVFSPGFEIGEESEFEGRINNAFRDRNIVIKDADLLFADENDGYEELETTGLTNYMHRHRGIRRLTILEAGTDQAVFIWR